MRATEMLHGFTSAASPTAIRLRLSARASRNRSARRAGAPPCSPWPSALRSRSDLRAAKNFSQDSDWKDRVATKDVLSDPPKYDVTVQSSWDFRLATGLGYRFLARATDAPRPEADEGHSIAVLGFASGRADRAADALHLGDADAVPAHAAAERVDVANRRHAGRAVVAERCTRRAFGVRARLAGAAVARAVQAVFTLAALAVAAHAGRALAVERTRGAGLLADAVTANRRRRTFAAVLRTIAAKFAVRIAHVVATNGRRRAGSAVGGARPAVVTRSVAANTVAADGWRRAEAVARARRAVVAGHPAAKTVAADGWRRAVAVVRARRAILAELAHVVAALGRWWRRTLSAIGRTHPAIVAGQRGADAIAAAGRRRALPAIGRASRAIVSGCPGVARAADSLSVPAPPPSTLQPAIVAAPSASTQSSPPLCLPLVIARSPSRPQPGPPGFVRLYATNTYIVHVRRMSNFMYFGRTGTGRSRPAVMLAFSFTP
jgi:hypothetical protein